VRQDEALSTALGNHSLGLLLCLFHAVCNRDWQSMNDKKEKFRDLLLCDITKQHDVHPASNKIDDHNYILVHQQSKSFLTKACIPDFERDFIRALNKYER
jgi:hypothetical protein